MRKAFAAALMIGGIALAGSARANTIVTESFTGTITSAGSHNGADVAGRRHFSHRRPCGSVGDHRDQWNIAHRNIDKQARHPEPATWLSALTAFCAAIPLKRRSA